MNLVLLALILRAIVSMTGGELIVGPTYAAAEWGCGGDYNCYVVIGHVPGEPTSVDYDLRGVTP